MFHYSHRYVIYVTCLERLYFLLVSCKSHCLLGKGGGARESPRAALESPGQLRATASLLRLWVWVRQPCLVDPCGCVSSELMALAGV